MTILGPEYAQANIDRDRIMGQRPQSSVQKANLAQRQAKHQFMKNTIPLHPINSECPCPEGVFDLLTVIM